MIRVSCLVIREKPYRPCCWRGRLAPRPAGPLAHFASPRGEKCRLGLPPHSPHAMQAGAVKTRLKGFSTFEPKGKVLLCSPGEHLTLRRHAASRTMPWDAGHQSAKSSGVVEAIAVPVEEKIRPRHAALAADVSASGQYPVITVRSLVSALELLWRTGGKHRAVPGQQGPDEFSLRHDWEDRSSLIHQPHRV